MSLGYTIDAVTLREVPNDADALTQRICEIERTRDHDTELVGWLRIVGRLDQAQLIAEETLISLGAPLETLGSDEELDVNALTAALRYAHVLQWQREFDRALAIFNQVVRTSESLFAQDPATSSGRAITAFAYQHRGKCFYDIGDDTSALADFDEALRLRTSANAASELIESTELAIAAVRARA